MQTFEYAAPSTLQGALALLQVKGNRARVLSGGTDLIVQVREDRRHLDTMIDIKKIPELMEMRYDPIHGLHLGASVPCYRIYEDPVIQKIYPGLVDAASLIGGVQIQSRASFGGNLCNSSPAADSIPALIAHHAVCWIAGSEGTRKVPVEDFCTAPGKNVLSPTELLVALKVPPPPKHFGASYLRFIPRNEMDIAVVGCGVSIELSADRADVRPSENCSWRRGPHSCVGERSRISISPEKESARNRSKKRPLRHRPLRIQLPICEELRNTGAIWWES